MSKKISDFMPQIQQMRYHQSRLKASLLVAHQKKNVLWTGIRIMYDNYYHMSKIQRSVSFSIVAIAGLIVTAGIFGTSDASIAHAEAQNTIDRSFARILSLSESDREILQEKFQDKIRLKNAAGEKFMGMKDFGEDFSMEDRIEMHAKMKASLADALIEARNAPDVKIIGADEMPMPGFIGRVGRTFGFKMVHRQVGIDEKIANLPEDVQVHMREHQSLHEDMIPTSFLVYTNADGKIVHLGLNTLDEPVVKFIDMEQGGAFPHPEGKRLMIRKSENK